MRLATCRSARALSDGVQDILLGSFLADGPENARYQGGEVYLILGTPSLSGARDMAQGEYDLALRVARVVSNTADSICEATNRFQINWYRRNSSRPRCCCID